MEFLDAIRGLAALAVAFHHSAEGLWRGYFGWTSEHFRPGEFGVLTFFLCSGFIIPASLEKHGSLRKFWISRFFRLYPLYWTCLLVLAVLMYMVPVYPVGDWLNAKAWILDATMIQGSLGQTIYIIGASWTLTFEMCFYLLCSLLLLAGVHRKSSQFAFLFFCAAAGTLPLPGHALQLGDKRLLVLALFVTVGLAGVALMFSAKDLRTRITVIGLSVLLALILINRYEGWHLALLWLGTMFTGTAIYRWYRGEISTRLIVGTTLFACFGYGAACYVNDVNACKPVMVTYCAAIAFFYLALALRGFTFPRPLVYLGTISYSVYLVHPIIIHTVPRLDSPALTLLFWLGLVVAFASVTYYGVEKPFQNLGRRFIDHKSARGLATAQSSGNNDHVVPAKENNVKMYGAP